MKLYSLRAALLALICAFSLPSFAESIDLNSASVEQLAQSLNGIGPAKAKAIVAYREQNGPFKSVDQLMAVKGIGAATVDKNREMMTVVQPLPEEKMKE